ncbi:hypothetical protein C8R43DRAFT_1140811 [Mycena crocata]|nr:hypothetical protein C8R43DRAFT_1140811 [Mycena crocata]
MSCGICLSKLKEPVSVPCGHVYCTDCLTAHVSATSPDGFTSTCPACRDTFNMVRPELTCLPKKFHQYIVPSIRRVYIDTSQHSALRKRLAASEARVSALEQDKERLMAECERHIAAARAHARGETDALLKAKDLSDELEETADALDETKEELDEAKDDLEATRETAANAQETLKALKAKYDKMKRHVRALEAGNKSDASVTLDEGASRAGKRNSSLVDLSMDVSPKRLRVIRPLPRSRLNPNMNPFDNSFSTPANRSRRPGNADLDLNCALGSPFKS